VALAAEPRKNYQVKPTLVAKVLIVGRVLVVVGVLVLPLVRKTITQSKAE
jgi:hypothetical protein